MILDELSDRGLVHQCTALDDLRSRMNKGPITLYAGFDPTSDSLHIGNLLALVTLLRFQKDGNTVISLIGGATGKIGDPSGKSQERSLLDDVTENIKSLSREIFKFFPVTTSIVNNADWTNNINLVDFLRDIGKCFSVNEMIKKDSVQSRLEGREQGISFTEFSYSLLQANDFLHLNSISGCELQIGGSDQWGNITAGIDLIRKKSQKQAFGLTMPLITDAQGKKFGKSEAGAIFLNKDKTSPYHFYQFWINTPDSEVFKLLKIFTFLTLEDIAAINIEHVCSPEKRLAQKTLASEMTKMVHGAWELTKVINASEILFGGSLEGISAFTLLTLSKIIPVHKICVTECLFLDIVKLLIIAGVTPSKREAKNKIQSGAICINNIKVTNTSLAIKDDTFIIEKYILIKSGKKDFFLIEKM